MSKSVSPMQVLANPVDSACLLTPEGVLDTTTYLQLRDAIVKAALDEPKAVLIDVNRLEVPAPSAWVVFTSARWLIDTWPAVPIHLICGDADRRRAMQLNGVTRYVRVHSTVDNALSALTDTQRPRLRARMELPAALASLRSARDFVAERLGEWSFEALVPAASVVANVFVENVLQHTPYGLALVLETDGTAVTVSVHDDSSQLAVRHEDPNGRDQVSGLAIVASLSRAWGCAPTPSGKSVWAVVGPENTL